MGTQIGWQIWADFLGQICIMTPNLLHFELKLLCRRLLEEIGTRDWQKNLKNQCLLRVKTIRNHKDKLRCIFPGTILYMTIWTGQYLHSHIVIYYMHLYTVYTVCIYIYTHIHIHIIYIYIDTIMLWIKTKHQTRGRWTFQSNVYIYICICPNIIYSIFLTCKQRKGHNALERPTRISFFVMHIIYMWTILNTISTLLTLFHMYLLLGCISKRNYLHLHPRQYLCLCYYIE